MKTQNHYCYEDGYDIKFDSKFDKFLTRTSKLKNVVQENQFRKCTISSSRNKILTIRCKWANPIS